MAKKKADNIINMIQAQKTIDLARFIYGLGIRHVGEEMASSLAQLVPAKNNSEILEINELADFFQKLNVADLEKINGSGPIIAKSVYEYWHNPINLARLKKFQKNGLKLSFSILKNTANQKLANQNFVLTGTLAGLTRGEAKDKIKTLGGKIKENVSRETDYVIVGDNPGSKYTQAKKLGVKILSEGEFLKMIK